MCDLSDSVFNDNAVIIVRVIINSVFYQITIDVSLPPDRSPFIANVGCNVNNLKWSKETIFYTFFQAICVYWLAKIADAWLVFGFFWRSSHTKLDSTIKVFKYFSPVAVVLGTASMTLIYNHHVEELWLKKFLVILFPFFPYQLLIKGEIYLVCQMSTMGCYIFLIIYFMDCVWQWLEILLDRLVDQYIPVCQIQHPLYQTR